MTKRLPRKVPVEAKNKRVVEVRRESNAELMHDRLQRKGKIRLRVSIQIQDATGNYYGWLGCVMFREERTIKGAAQFVERLKKFVRE